MPNSTEILAGLSRIANAGFGVAVAWHVALGALLVALVAGWRPPVRAIAAFAIAMLASVCAAAWAFGNPFNAAAFAALVVALAIIARSAPSGRSGGSTRVASAFGGLLAAFAWSYPHFLHGRPALAYMIAAPIGLVPCPTLALLIGLALAGYRPEARSWSIVLGATGLLYGAFGVFRLSVAIDVALIIGSIVLIAQARRASTRTATAAPDRSEIPVHVSSRRRHEPRPS